MNTDEASQRGAEEEEYPSWFSAYLRSLTIKNEEVKAAELDTVLQFCNDVSQVFRSTGQSPSWKQQEKLKQKL